MREIERRVSEGGSSLCGPKRMSRERVESHENSLLQVRTPCSANYDRVQLPFSPPTPRSDPGTVSLFTGFRHRL